MPYDFLIGGKKSSLSPDASKKKELYTAANRNKLTMDPKAIFIASPPTPHTETISGTTNTIPYCLQGYVNSYYAENTP